MRGAVVALLILLMLVTPAMAVSPGLPPAVVKGYPDGAVLHLPFDEGSGNITYNAVDPTQLNGTLLDANTTNADGATPPQWVSGIAGSALQFDGVDDYVEGTGSLISSQVTVSIWVKQAAWTDYHHPLFVWGTTGDQLYFIIDLNKYIDLRTIVNGTDTWEKYYIGDAYIGKWTMYTAVYDHANGIFKLYINGNLIKSWTVPKGLSFNFTNNIFRVGRSTTGYWGNGFFYGNLDELIVFNRALSDEEVKLLYELTKPHKFSSQPTITPISIPIIDINSDQTVTVEFTESTSETNAYLPIPVAATNVNPANWVYSVNGDVMQIDDNRYVNATSVTFEIPLSVNSYVEKELPNELYLDSDTKTFEYKQSVRISNPSGISIMATLSVDPSTIGVAQAYLDGSPMSLFNGSLVSSIIIGPGESKVMELTATLPISKQELEFRATLNDFFEIDSFDEAMTLAQTLAQSATEGKIETVAKVIAIDSADFKSFGNRTVIIPLDVKASDVIEAKALTGSKELLEVREGKDGKAEIVVPATVFEGTPLNTQHAEIKVIYNKKPVWWERLPFLKSLGRIFGFLSKLFGFGR